MTPDVRAQHEFPNGDVLQLLRQPRGADYALAYPIGGLEATIEFDRVDVGHNEIACSREIPDGPPSHHHVAGTLEGDYTEYGAVGRALQRIAQGMPPRRRAEP